MTDALTAWKARSRKDVTLPSGTKVTIRLPDIQDMIAAGEIPLPVLAKMQKAGDNPDNLTPEDVANTRTFQRKLTAVTIVAVEGQPVELTDADLDEIPAEDRAAIANWAMRTNEAIPVIGNGAASKRRTND